MKLNMMKIGVLAAAGIIPLAQNSFADIGKQEVKPYIGANYGASKSRGDEFDDENDLYEGVLGVHLSPYFGIEGSYTNFGEFGGDRAETEIDGYGIAAFGRLPLSDVFALYVKGGYFWWEADVTVDGGILGSADVDDAVEGEEPFYGVGVDFQVAEHFSLSLEYLRYEFDLSDSSLPDIIDDYETDIDTVKVGAKFLF